MEYRSEIVEELFRLRIALNKSNLKSNQRTELNFRIQKSLNAEVKIEFVGYLEGVKNSAFLVLSHKRKKLWTESNLNQFPYLEEFCTNELNRLTQNNDLYIIEQIKKQLRALGIKK